MFSPVLLGSSLVKQHSTMLLILPLAPIRNLELCELAAKNWIGLLECDRQMVGPTTFQVLPPIYKHMR